MDVATQTVPLSLIIYKLVRSTHEELLKTAKQYIFNNPKFVIKINFNIKKVRDKRF